MPKLLLFLQDGGAREVLFDKDRITVGRRSDNDVPLPYPAVSGRHAVISCLSADKCYVEDLKSTNGTLLNGAPIFERQQLKDRDQIDIGGQKFVFLEGMKPVEGVKPKSDKSDKKPKAPKDNKTTAVSETDVTIPPNLSLTPPHEYLNAPPTIPGLSEPLSERELDEEEAISGLHFPTIIKTSSDDNHPRNKAKKPAPLPTLDSDLVPPPAVESDLPGAATPLPLEEPTYHLPPPVASLTAVAGPNEERRLPLRYGEYVLGRPGYQLAVIRVSEEGCRLLPMEGEPPIELRGEVISPEGVLLADQDTFTVGRSPLLFELSKPGGAPPAS
ncbi:MAG: FHA domain-containing protein [Burkholderiales bacterium]|jgi:pSer/pThr/pTyr-binding forkhead associated (FHA) protein|nr:FHA domain-containing protein [Burkholderiales bacterium]